MSGGWLGQGRPSGQRHHAGQLINALTGKMVLRFFVVGATAQCDSVQPSYRLNPLAGYARH